MGSKTELCKLGFGLFKCAILISLIIVLCMLLNTCLFVPQAAEGAEKLYMTNSPGIWCYLEAKCLNPFTFDWVRVNWLLFFLYL